MFDRTHITPTLLAKEILFQIERGAISPEADNVYCEFLHELDALELSLDEYSRRYVSAVKLGPAAMPAPEVRTFNNATVAASGLTATVNMQYRSSEEAIRVQVWARHEQL